MKGKKPAAAGLFLALFAVLAMVLNVAGASATEVTPTNDLFEANAGLTKFITENGTGTVVECKKSVAKGQVPGTAVAGYGFNKVVTASGAVTGPLSLLEFNECSAGGKEATVSVKGPDTYTALQGAGATADKAFAINLVPDAATITALGGTCTINTPDNGTAGVADSVIGTFTNGVAPSGALSKLSVKSQLPIKASAGCGTQKSQAVFFANGELSTTVYEIKDLTTPTARIEVK